MKHPLDFIPDRVRKRLFLALLVWTLGLFAVMQVLNQPLITGTAPAGIVSFELAGTPEQAFQIMVSWSNQVSDPALINRPMLYAAFGLGFDYLFMPSYALTIALAVLLASGRHKGWFVSLGTWIGWGSLVAALFDAMENLALFNVLLYWRADSSWPQIAFWCASVKFGLIGLGVGYALLGAILSKSK
ncbi:MAG: hypothetical protein HY258_05365 [Chloroflexi bacterium]|nr:hypothetical protein [Chloroflexota bacterium]